MGCGARRSEWVRLGGVCGVVGGGQLGGAGYRCGPLRGSSWDGARNGATSTAWDWIDGTEVKKCGCDDMRLGNKPPCPNFT
ncbi:hypothetical protein IMZ48_26020 [Candidatus Bathyarchaeota archaeon]|nr:hypothetical protein [Candidatus Bathyarchaeota archaeon]